MTIGMAPQITMKSAIAVPVIRESVSSTRSLTKEKAASLLVDVASEKQLGK